MSAMASQITGASIVCSIVCAGADQMKHQSCAPLVFVRGTHRWPVDSPNEGPVTRKCFHLMTSSCTKQPTPYALISLPTHILKYMQQHTVLHEGMFARVLQQCLQHRWIRNRWAGLIRYIRFIHVSLVILLLQSNRHGKIDLQMNILRETNDVFLHFINSFCYGLMWLGSHIPLQ